MTLPRSRFTPLMLITALCLFPAVTQAAESGPPDWLPALDTVWLAVAAALVFFMQAGFALLESGMSRAKNAVNVVMKNYVDVCLGSLAFWLVGYGLMFGFNPTGWFGQSHFALIGAENGDYMALLFQTMFAATAVTIASGAMAERTRYQAYLLGAVLITAIIYPVYGSWAWGGAHGGEGWLASLGFIDFAGSTVVHSIGGWVALAGVLVLGPRLGRFGPNGERRPIHGHNLTQVALGGFILWVGWFGFNGGSTGGADVSIGLINLNTHLSAAAGAAGALILLAILRQPVLLTTTVNASIGGLVGITAGAATMDPHFAVVTGLVSGMIVVAGTRLLESLGLDDVVGAVSAHGLAGAWGTLAAGLFLAGDLFNPMQVAVQLIGILAGFLWAFPMALLMYFLIDRTVGLRASTVDEQRGLDFSEHYEIGYPEFQADVLHKGKG
ncbi:ammonium transporter [Thioalkalivibrio sulfidiphilus HL-EbGr7]|uniref:Ammonium transporter n=1 Tax=Thioalkalivibrio sulfidiphilus (strain HL-EbGR7) TaxID=396588 RepID=B8GU26_THISH|nr:ammonium transporter [Thioalkalivibrio sulfidiphilus]ACL71309.1 ammonium transporter [Thioalkalivibrio sulfidiphilus HL-EbGr7]